MDDLLKDYQKRAIRSGEYRERNNHKHSMTNSKENNDNSFSPTDCHYSLGNNFD
jgi:hypothetical protein